MRAYPPLPIRGDWTPSYLLARGTANRDFAFWYPDKQGMPSHTGRRYHGAVDWFAPPGTVVKAPAAGRVYRCEHSDETEGQVFGGVLGIEDPQGRCWVMRHVTPTVSLGAYVNPGDPVAAVTDWKDGGDHLHQEIWRTLRGGYNHDNAIDPKTVEWSTGLLPAVKAPSPPPDGDTLRLTIQTDAERTAGKGGRVWAGWEECDGALRWIAAHGLRPTSKVALAWRRTVRRYDPAEPAWVSITHPDGRVQRITPTGGGARYMASVASSLATTYL